MDKRILVTGVASGIGAATARLLIEKGATVVGVDRNEAPSDLKLARFRQIDLANPASIDAVLDDLEGTFDGVANVAGASSAATTEVQFRVNFLGTRHLVNRIEPRLAPKASVVNVASGTAIRWLEWFPVFKELALTPDFEAGLAWLKEHPQDGLHSYSRSKQALIAWSQLKAVEWTPTERRMNTVSPGPVATPMLTEFRAALGDQFIDFDLGRTRRAAVAEDIAPTIVFLLDDASAWVHGADIAVDGGFSAGVLTDPVKWPPDD
jgi:NAD(P)-dependent dehydrogenase (short-subunit alcohol dehydrogenase family)